MDRSLRAVLIGTFTLRFSTGLTGALLGFYFARLSRHPGSGIDTLTVGAFAAAFYLAELVLAPLFGILSDRLGHHRVMQIGPIVGIGAVIITGLTTNVHLLGGTRILEGASTAASVPSILGYIALASAGDELLRGRAAARFEGATLAGLGVGTIVAPKLFELLGPRAFFLNALIYLGSWLIYRYGVADPRGEAASLAGRHAGWRGYLRLVSDRGVLLLAPTWIAINAVIGLWFSQSLFQFARRNDRFPRQLLHQGFSATEITIAAIVIFAVFGAGLLYWGDRFRSLRRTTIIFYGVLGGAVMAASLLVINHAAEVPAVLPIASAIVAGVGLFVLAGATPAALGLLADVSEGFPHDRGAIMGLYSVFLAIGQIVGSLLGGVAGQLRGIDGLLIATLVALAVALIPLSRLRALEHVIDAAGSVSLAR